MGNRQWGHGYRTGHEKGLTKGLIIGISISLAVSAIKLVGDYISTRELRVDKIIKRRGLK